MSNGLLCVQLRRGKSFKDDGVRPLAVQLDFPVGAPDNG